MGRSNKREKVVTKRQSRELSRRFKPKPCHFCIEKIDWIDYKDVGLLRKYVSDRGKIRARKITGTCVQHQREISVAVKTARELILLPYSQRDFIIERSGHRGYGRNYNFEDEATLDDVMKSEQYIKSQESRQFKSSQFKESDSNRSSHKDASAIGEVDNGDYDEDLSFNPESDVEFTEEVMEDNDSEFDGITSEEVNVSAEVSATVDQTVNTDESKDPETEGSD